MYDNTVYTEPDGSKWWRIFHHNSPSTTGLFSSSDDFANGVYYNENKWFEVNLAKEYDAKEFLVKQKLESTSAEQVIRFTQTVNPMDATYNDVSPSSGNVVLNTSAGYVSDPYAKGGLYKKGSGVYICHANANSVDWWGGVGCMESWGGGIPAMQIGSSNEICKTGYIDVYMPAQHTIRIDPTKASLSWRPSTTTAQLTDESNWTATSNAQWLTVSPSSGIGSENPTTMTFTATQNDTGVERTAIVTITDSEQYTETFTVTQGWHGNLTVNEKLFKGSQGIRKEYDGSTQVMKMYRGSDLVFQRKTFSPTLSVKPDTMTFKAEDVAQTAQISTNTNWTASTSAQWLTLEKSGNTLTVTPANYASEEEDRTATVTITASNGDITVSKTVSVLQKKHQLFYTQIESGGNCWWDTGIVLSTVGKITAANVRFNLDGSSSGHHSFIGCTGNAFRFSSKETNKWFQRMTNGTEVAGGNGNGDNRLTADLVTLTRTGIDIDGTAYTWSDRAFAGTETIWIFNSYNTTGGDCVTAGTRCGTITVYDTSDNIIANFEPFIDDNDNVTWYNTLTETFLTNQGSGTPIGID